MKKDFILHVLRNPFGLDEATIRTARLIAADIIDKLPEVVVHYYSKKYDGIVRTENGEGSSGR